MGKLGGVWTKWKREPGGQKWYYIHNSLIFSWKNIEFCPPMVPLKKQVDVVIGKNLVAEVQ